MSMVFETSRELPFNIGKVIGMSRVILQLHFHHDI